MIAHVLRAAKALHPSHIVTVIAPDMADVMAVCALESIDDQAAYLFAVQDSQLGTGHAVRCAIEELKLHAPDFNGNILVLYGDVPLITPECLSQFLNDFEVRKDLGASFMAMAPPDPTGFGRIFQNSDGTLKEIVEEKDADADQKLVRLVNSGIVVFRAQNILKYLNQLDNNNQQGEYYLVDLPKILKLEKINTGIFRGPYQQLRGVNNRAQLAELEQLWQDTKRNQMMNSGVTLLDPTSVYFCSDTQIGRDTVIGQHVIFGPNVKIAENVEIKAFSYIEDAVIENCASIGPFARIRPHSHIESDVKIGNFVEIKGARIKKGAKANHLAYLGDVELGEHSNFGCGAITVNYDGQTKSKTIIGDNVMVGSNASLIAPLKVGDGAYIAAGSCVTQDIEPDALVIGRSKQLSFPGRAKGRLKRPQ